MTRERGYRLRVTATVIATVVIGLLLLWEHAHGGIPRHHFLNRADMPAVSNAWSGLLFPELTWFLVGRMIRRDGHHVAIGFGAALLYGAALAVTFLTGHENITQYLFFGMFALALAMPVYRGEYVLGFIVGMTPTFGAILPAFFASLIAAPSGIVHYYVHPVFRR